MSVSPTAVFIPKIISNPQELYYEFSISNESIPTIAQLSYSSGLQRLVWDSSYHEWHVMSSVPRDECDKYGQCGPNAICTVSDSQICSCLTGYMPKISRDWGMLIWSGGCIRKNPLNCLPGEGFIELESVKMPDLLKFWVNPNMKLTQYVSPKLYIRVAASDLVSKKKKKMAVVVVVLMISAPIAVVLVIASCVICKKISARVPPIQDTQVGDHENLDLPIFHIVIIAEATNNFSHTNKIGEGGFGPVYKAWKLWTEGRAHELIDPLMEDSLPMSEISRCIQVGLLCVQQLPKDRPTMSCVVRMLDSESAMLPQPMQPGFYTERSHVEAESSVSGKTWSMNEVTNSQLEGR
ncbi:unnamed protein product [Ilex paraguariensis]|uniref:EGF-like domain-containing protein n=1 Tax=Ilex paraguariensis TaxID=185542 RepID=A0ABC8UK43_9AQUA